MKPFAILLILFCLPVSGAVAQRTDLTGLKICIDPGHGGHNSDDRHVIPDPGIDFWESESNFQKALLLRSLLVEYGATVILTRTSNDTTYGTDDEPSLAARVEVANSNNVDWFHSIHSNALGGTNTSTNYTLILVREKRPGGPASSTGNGLGVPEDPASLAMANIMGPMIKANNRTSSTSTWLDWTFYGGTNGGFSLGVLRGLLMPGELSEGSFHDFYPETRRLMNNDYRKMEAYALRNAFLQYYGVPADQHSIIAGIQSDISTSSPLNNTFVRLLPEGRGYHGDTMNNGYYLFDSLTSGDHTVVFETPGFSVDSVLVTSTAGQVQFIDHVLQRSGPPYVVSAIPLNGDSSVIPSVRMTLTFSRPMDTASVDHAFSILPSVPGNVSWSNSNCVMAFQPTPAFGTLTTYTARLDTSAHGITGGILDGNADGTAGDPFLLSFKTEFVDVVPPVLTARFPDTSGTATSPFDVIDLMFNERLDPSTVNSSNIRIQQLGGAVLPRTVQYWESRGKGAVNVYISGGLRAGTGYRLYIVGVADVAGNAIGAAQAPTWTFSVAPFNLGAETLLDSLNLGSVPWPSPSTADGTMGVDNVGFLASSMQGVGTEDPARGAFLLNYTWTDLNQQNLIHVIGPENIGTTHWTTSETRLQCYINGDGSGTRFRFVVRDSAQNGTDREVSQWVAVDWIGWRLIQWNFAQDSLGAWSGDGVLNGLLSFEGFQIAPSAADTSRSGQLGFNDLALVSEIPSAVPTATGGVPLRFGLDQNYPNPFNPTTVISGEWTVSSDVSLIVYDVLGREVAVLAHGHYPAGKHSFSFDASRLASGVYFCRLTANALSATKAMMLVK